MKVLLIGSGGREHAIAWKLLQSSRLEKLYVAPGNAGTSRVAENVAINVNEYQKLVDFARAKQIDLTVVGPDDPLAGGIVDIFKQQELRIWGPSAGAAQIEASKAFAKQLMTKANIPTAGYKIFTSLNEALEFVVTRDFPVVIKASGLALGKGVKVVETLDDAKDFLNQIFVDKIFGDAGEAVVIEDYLEGQEVSIHAFSDGKNYKLMPSAQDHKPVFEGDKGPNTGGMGTFAPVPWVSNELMEKIEDEVIKPTFRSLESSGNPFVGCLFPGLKITPAGPKVLEFNARFGDPETQSLMRLLKTDLLEIFEACVDGKLSQLDIEWDEGFACCIVLASDGYPGVYKKGMPITGIEEAEQQPDVVAFHAGTALDDGNIVTSGGRVLGVTATGSTLTDALSKAYSAVRLINFEGMQYRNDIGAKAL